MSIEVRNATIDDMAAVGSIYVNGHWGAYRGSVPYKHLLALDPNTEAASFTAELDNPNAIFLVAVNGSGRVVGFAFGGRANDPGHGGLAELFVDRRYRSRGVAVTLLRKFAARLAALGVQTMSGVVAVCNGRSRGFCSKMGAVEANQGEWFGVFGNAPEVDSIDLPAVQVHWDHARFEALVDANPG